MKSYDVGDLVRVETAFMEISVGATAVAATDTFTSAGHGLIANDPVRLRGTLLPAGVVEGQTYYVVSPTANTFKLSETSGGAAVDLSGGGRALVSKLVDPAIVKAIHKTPAGAVVTKTYGTDSEVVKVSTGRYYMDISVTADGTWVYRWESTGTGQAAEERSFFVRKKAAA